MVNTKHKWAKVGDEVFYKGKVGRVLQLDWVYDGIPTLCLEYVENPEQTCTAKEDDCLSISDWWEGDVLTASGIQY